MNILIDNIDFGEGTVDFDNTILKCSQKQFVDISRYLFTKSGDISFTCAVCCLQYGCQTKSIRMTKYIRTGFDFEYFPNDQTCIC